MPERCGHKSSNSTHNIFRPRKRRHTYAALIPLCRIAYGPPTIVGNFFASPAPAKIDNNMMHGRATFYLPKAGLARINGLQVIHVANHESQTFRLPA